MSPEQARGKPVDKRTDVWAFGCVLYEMLTWQLAFGGEDVAVIMARVIANDTNMDSLPAMISPAVRHTIKLCLQKDPNKRIRDIGDVKLALAGTFEPEVLTQGAAHAAPRSIWQRPLPVGAAMLVLGIAVTGLAALVLEPAPAPAPLNRFSYAMPSDLDFRRQGENVIAVEPNGRHFVMNTAQGLFLRSMDALQARLIAGTEEDLDTPFFAPDGQSIAYWTPDGAIKRIGISGGAPVVIANGIGNPLGASWEGDGTILIADSTGILRFPANGGSPELLFPAGDNEQFQAPQLLPDGDTVLYSIAEGANWDSARIVVQSISSGERRVLIQGGSAARYVDSGHIVYALENDLFAMAFDADALTVSGGVVPLVQNVSRALYIRAGLANYAISNDGALVYRVGTDAGLGGRDPVWVDREGREMPVGMPPCICMDPKVSPDGTRIAFQQASGQNNNADIWIWSLAQGTFSRLTFGPQDARSPVWSPDSQRIAYSTVDGVFVRRADGTGSVERLLEDGGIYLNTWSEDGELIYTAQTGDTDTAFDVGALSVDSSMPRTLVSSAFGEWRPELSPDGRWLAYASNESGQTEIYVRPYPDVEAGRWQISTNSGDEPQWSADSRTLFFFNRDSMMAARVTPGSTFEFATPEPIFSRSSYVTLEEEPRRYAVSGDQLLMLKAPNSGNSNGEIVIVQNFVEELKRLVPTD
jgi:serine/threonine-protein kinase